MKLPMVLNMVVGSSSLRVPWLNVADRLCVALRARRRSVGAGAYRQPSRRGTLEKRRGRSGSGPWAAELLARLQPVPLEQQLHVVAVDAGHARDLRDVAFVLLEQPRQVL